MSLQCLRDAQASREHRNQAGVYQASTRHRLEQGVALHVFYGIVLSSAISLPPQVIFATRFRHILFAAMANTRQQKINVALREICDGDVDLFRRIREKDEAADGAPPAAAMPAADDAAPAAAMPAAPASWTSRAGASSAGGAAAPTEAAAASGAAAASVPGSAADAALWAELTAATDALDCDDAAWVALVGEDIAAAASGSVVAPGVVHAGKRRRTELLAAARAIPLPPPPTFSADDDAPISEVLAMRAVAKRPARRE